MNTRSGGFSTTSSAMIPKHDLKRGAVPISIKKTPKKTVKAIAASCPNFTFVPPRAPAPRPSVPNHDPPPMCLPPSPPVFSPIEIKTAQEQAQQIQRILSRQYVMSSSCPSFDPSFGVLAQRIQGARGNRESPEKPGSGLDIPNTRRVIDADVLGKSPTIFSLLSSSATARDVPPFVTAKASEPGSHLSQGNLSLPRHSEADELLFAFSMDDNNDGEFLGSADADGVRGDLDSLFI